jgi:hypothetical protein
MGLDLFFGLVINTRKTVPSREVYFCILKNFKFFLFFYFKLIFLDNIYVLILKIIF